MSSEASGLQAPCLETRVGFCFKTLASELGQCPSFQATRMQTLERSPPILPTHSRSPELYPHQALLLIVIPKTEPSSPRAHCSS